MRQVVVGAREQHALVDPLAALDDPRDVEQLLAGLALELAPELVCASQQRDVVGMLEVGEPDDPGEPVRGALLVRHVETLEPEDALAAPGKVIQRRAAHASDPDDDNVVALAHRRTDPTAGQRTRWGTVESGDTTLVGRSAVPLPT